MKRTIYDLDAGYGILALDGDKYISPGHPENRCIEAPMRDCIESIAGDLNNDYRMQLEEDLREESNERLRGINSLPNVLA